MKIIEDRSMQSPHFPYRWRCRSCDSELEADSEDVKKGEFGGAWCESGDIKLYVTCPVCGQDKPFSSDEARKVPVARKKALGYRY